ncbi:Retrovirus-related Pol polyprotein from transposon 17.6 [Eumeta japonica]|uniref:RNA-directed DNA polymerase n=1 Tax=Eumeta variegata TaxID=151549 RepID=A0A4C1WSH3_EUMVA|nr:Retrovirus-related Pol polyprotein from transposon 17.6 [Eumeta japonica]
MNDILKGLIGNICLVYLDDIIIYSENKKQHLERLKKVFDALQRANLKINKNKCKFLKTEVEFLGHRLTPQGIRPTQDKIEAITKFPLPRTVKETKSFLGLIDEVKRAFKQSKDLLTNAPILSYPDYNNTFTLTTDASDKALGAVLSQNQHPIAYASRTLSETERRYNTTEKELLAVLWACQHFRPYIYGRKFNLETDHQPLTWLSKLKEPNAKLTRWRLRLQEYDYDIKHTKGRENKVADALSRIELQNNESNAATVHSNNDDDETGIPIVNGFAHSRKNRIFLQESPTPKWKRNKNDVYIKIPLVNFDTEFSKNWKKYIDLKKTDYAVVTQNEKLFYKLSEFYRKNVDKKSLKLKRYTEILTEINDREQQLKLMKSAHENNDAHIGSTLMYETLKKQYYWKKLKDDVLKYVHDCSICQRNKYERRPPKTPLEYTITPEAPLQIWHIDTLVIDGTQYLTAIDKFTKYFAAEKIEGNDSISYIRSLTKIIKYLGKPKHVVHDPDKLMNSLTFKEHLTNLLSIDVHQTSIRHHTSNGDIERAHSTIIEKYRVIRELHPGEDKEELMALTITCYNSTEHSVTKCTPHQALFGLEPNQIEIPDEAILLQNYNKKRYDLLRNLHNTIIGNMDLAKGERIKRENRKRKITEPIEKGTSVYIPNHKHRRNKKEPPFVGPYPVIKTLPRNTYLILGPRNNKMKYHKDELRIAELPSTQHGESSRHSSNPTGP